MQKLSWRACESPCECREVRGEAHKILRGDQMTLGWKNGRSIPRCVECSERMVLNGEAEYNEDKQESPANNARPSSENSGRVKTIAPPVMTNYVTREEYTKLLEKVKYLTDQIEIMGQRLSDWQHGAYPPRPPLMVVKNPPIRENPGS